MSLKDNFNQALKEILKGDSGGSNPPVPPAAEPSALDSFISEQDGAAGSQEQGGLSGSFSSAVPNFTDTAEFFRQSVNRSNDPFRQPLSADNFPDPMRGVMPTPLGMSVSEEENPEDEKPPITPGNIAAQSSEPAPDTFTDTIPENIPLTGQGDDYNEAAAAAIADAAAGIPGSASAPPPNSMAAAMNAAMNAAMGTAMGAGASAGGYSQPRPAAPSGRMGGTGRGSGGGMFPPPPPSPPPIRPSSPFPADPVFYESEETTVISRNIVITGGTITGFANVHIDGSIKCDVRITKDVNVTGKVVGDITCNNAVMSGSSIQGSIASKGQVRMDRDSVLLGDISTEYLDINGRVKGSVAVGGKAEFKTDAVVVGDITASTITVLDGAVIKGYVNTTFLQDSETNVFPDAITVSDQ